MMTCPNFPETEKFILFASPRSVRGIPLEEPGEYPIDAIPPIVGQRWGRLGVNYVALDYDSHNETVFFSDVRNRVIYRGKIGQSGECLHDCSIDCQHSPVLCSPYSRQFITVY